MIGVAKTGSGKTLAFLLPFFSRLLKEGLRPATAPGSDLPVQMQKQAAGPGAYSPDVLVLAPSRELAVQIETEGNKFTSTVGISALAAYGGEGLRRGQLGALRERPQCVVGTVGRLADFIENEAHWFSVKTVRFLVLDEADHMIGEGLSTNIRKITCDVESPHRQTALFSATFAEDVSDLATWITRHAVEVRVGMKDPLRANRDVDQRIMIVKDDGDKEGALKSLLRKQYASQAKNPGKVLIFAGSPEECDDVAKKLKIALNNANVETLHGNRKQVEREKAMLSFRSGEAPIMVATGVAGRGLDVKDIQMVVNYEPPEDGQDYVHRIGRTGRAGMKGVAVTLLRKGPDGRAMIYIAQVMRRTGLAVPPDLIYALKQRRGRDMCMAAEVLQGLCSFEQVDRSWAKAI
uniref:RNA helicase n=1 Tax=Zooxanthella nutricula TaxID=1333877 RepID=A0A7S2Q6L6_9DINO